jgi:hypothetical protein
VHVERSESHLELHSLTGPTPSPLNTAPSTALRLYFSLQTQLNSTTTQPRIMCQQMACVPVFYCLASTHDRSPAKEHDGHAAGFVSLDRFASVARAESVPRSFFFRAALPAPPRRRNRRLQHHALRTLCLPPTRVSRPHMRQGAPPRHLFFFVCPLMLTRLFPLHPRILGRRSRRTSTAWMSTAGHVARRRSALHAGDSLLAAPTLSHPVQLQPAAAHHPYMR